MIERHDRIIGSDKEIHTYAYVFTRYGPDYFINNTDVQGKTEQETGIFENKTVVHRHRRMHHRYQSLSPS